MNHELAQLEETTLTHYNAPVEPSHSLPAAQSLINRLKIINKPVPLAVQRFMDRMSDQKERGLKDKLARDLHSAADYKSLPAAKQSGIDELSDAIRSHSPAVSHPYRKAGLTFAQARHILVATYKEQAAMRPGDDIRHKLSDFAFGLEKDLDESAKRGGFFQEYSGQLKQLKAAIMKGRQ